MRGTCLCVFRTLVIFFLDLHAFVLDPGIFFSTAKLIKLIVSELGFLFFGPVRMLPGPCLHRVGGELHCYRRSHWQILLEPVHVFLTWHRVGGI